MLDFMPKFSISATVIISLEGILSEADVLSVTIEINGIGYFVNIPLTVGSKLPPPGEKIKLQIYPVYREDRQDLYGFLTREERNFFKLVVEKVSGIGPRTALNIMSKLSLSVLKQAISDGNAEILAKCHGIGKKSAERMIMELSDKDIFKLSSAATSNVPASSNANDAMAALISLGYKMGDAEKAIRKSMELLGSDAPTEKIIRSALSS
ncbi:MAG: Holliday junction branch migration protein RuvA [Puniceicoccales bacterium]|jgi:Holliday junction DNA helicase RuvA|nr:Holliday junction branch migration protein RuvA [Puniceicoccales bacterium]